MTKYLRNIRRQIKKRDSYFFDTLYRMVNLFRQVSVPHNRVIHSFLYYEWTSRLSSWHNFWRVVYYEPMFKSQCTTVGKNFRMEYAGNGSAKIFGGLSLYIGQNVTIFDNTMFVGLNVLDNAELNIGDNTYIGPLVRFMVGDRVTIGKNCLITSRIITDNPGHPIDDVLARMSSGGGAPPPDTIRPITIGDFCFLPLDTVVYPGVSIGDGVVARVGTHINKDVPSFCQVAGNPMRIIRKLPIPDEMKEIAGEERFNVYLTSHARLEL